jgi:hypothetical protein
MRIRVRAILCVSQLSQDVIYRRETMRHLIVLAVMMIAIGGAAAQSNTTGAVRGQFVDERGNPIADAFVYIEGDGLPRFNAAETTKSDARGEFVFTGLPPGRYTLRADAAGLYTLQPDVFVAIGTEVFVRIEHTGAGPWRPRPPALDTGSAAIGVDLPPQYAFGVPVGRTAGAIIGVAPGAQDDQYGVSFFGSTSPENVYVVEGLNTTDPAFGGQSTDLPVEFLGGVRVLTGGAPAEYGRFTGGAIHVVTRNGSDVWGGSVFAYYRPGGLAAEAKHVQRDGTAISRDVDLVDATDIGFEVGGPILRDVLWFHAGYSPSIVRDTVSRITSSQVDRVDANGAAPDACETGAEIEGDCLPDIDPATGLFVTEEVARLERARFRQTHYVTAKVSGALGDDDHHFDVAAFGNPRHVDRDLFRLAASPEASLYQVDDGAYDVVGRWSSLLAGGATTIDVLAGRHASYEHNDPYFAGGEDRASMSFANVRPLSELEAIAPCTDGGVDDPFPGIVNCPVLNYTTNGLGFLESRDHRRDVVGIAVTQRVQAAGTHTLKVGADAELLTYDAHRRHTGGAVYSWRRPVAGAPRQWRRRAFAVIVPDGGFPCLGGDTECSVDEPGYVSKNDSRSIALYLQDTWRPWSDLTVNAGVRWEHQTVYVAEALRGQTSADDELIPDAAFTLGAMIAPRVGVTWDPSGEGRGRVFGHVGRYYEAVPLDLNVRAFGGELMAESYISCPEATIDASQETLDGCQQFERQAVLGGGIQYVAPGTGGQYMEELILGAEQELRPGLELGVTFIARRTPRVIEDMSPNGSDYVIGNPGESYAEEVAELVAEAMALDAGDLERAALLRQRAELLRGVERFESPVRNYQAFQVTARQRVTDRALLLASYTHSRSRGNYAGLFSTETGQLDPNVTSMYDVPELMTNRYGTTGLDRPHVVQLDGYYGRPVGGAGTLVLGASLRGQSGIAHNALGAHDIYGPGESYLLARGSQRRSPFTTTADLKLSYGHRLAERRTVEAFVDFFNLFNAQAEIDADEIYTLESLNPVVGGDPDDLRHAKRTGTGTTAEVSRNYLAPTAYQPPFSMRFGVRYSF